MAISSGKHLSVRGYLGVGLALIACWRCSAQQQPEVEYLQGPNVPRCKAIRFVCQDKRLLLATEREIYLWELGGEKRRFTDRELVLGQLSQNRGVILAEELTKTKYGDSRKWVACDLVTSTVTPLPVDPKAGGFTAITISPDGQRAAFAWNERTTDSQTPYAIGEIIVVDIAAGKEAWRFAGERDEGLADRHPHYVKWLGFSAAGDTLVCQAESGVFVLELPVGKPAVLKSTAKRGKRGESLSAGPAPREGTKLAIWAGTSRLDLLDGTTLKAAKVSHLVDPPARPSRRAADSTAFPFPGAVTTVVDESESVTGTVFEISSDGSRAARHIQRTMGGQDPESNDQWRSHVIFLWNMESGKISGAVRLPREQITPSKRTTNPDVK